MKFNQMQFSMQHRPFNMDAATLDRINDKLSKSNDAAIEGDLLTRFRGLKVVYLDIKFKIIDEKERFIMAEKIKEIGQAFKEKPQTAGRQSAMLFLSQQTSLLETKIDEMEELLFELLFKYDIIHLKKIKNPALEDEIAADFE